MKSRFEWEESEGTVSVLLPRRSSLPLTRAQLSESVFLTEVYLQTRIEGYLFFADLQANVDKTRMDVRIAEDCVKLTLHKCDSGLWHKLESTLPKAELLQRRLASIQSQRALEKERTARRKLVETELRTEVRKKHWAIERRRVECERKQLSCDMSAAIAECSAQLCDETETKEATVATHSSLQTEHFSDDSAAIRKKAVITSTFSKDSSKSLLKERSAQKLKKWKANASRIKAAVESDDDFGLVPIVQSEDALSSVLASVCHSQISLQRVHSRESDRSSANAVECNAVECVCRNASAKLSAVKRELPAAMESLFATALAFQLAVACTFALDSDGLDFEELLAVDLTVSGLKPAADWWRRQLVECVSECRQWLTAGWLLRRKNSADAMLVEKRELETAVSDYKYVIERSADFALKRKCRMNLTLALLQSSRFRECVVECDALLQTTGCELEERSKAKVLKRKSACALALWSSTRQCQFLEEAASAIQVAAAMDSSLCTKAKKIVGLLSARRLQTSEDSKH